MEVILSSLCVLCAIFGSASGILAGNDRPNDITNTAEFGCTWFSGGILNCTCWPESKTFNIEKDTIPTYDLSSITIAACKKVRFGTNAINNMRSLRLIHLKNINSLLLDEYSLSWEGYIQNLHQSWELNVPTLKITFENLRVEKISSYTFKGRIGSVNFVNVSVNNISAFAFTNLQQTESINFEHSRFGTVEPQAFKKFPVQRLTIHKTSFGVLPSRSFSDIAVLDTFLITNSSFSDIKSGAFLINYPRRVEISRSSFRLLEGEAFRVIAQGDVLFSENFVGKASSGAFHGFSLLRPEKIRPHYLKIEESKFETAGSNSFQVNRTSFEPKFVGVHIRENCSCELSEEFLRLEYLEDVRCWYEGGDYILMKDYKKGSCSIYGSYTTTIVIACVSAGLLVIVLAVLIVYFKRVYRCDKYGEKNDAKGTNKSLIVPDGRTYRETEIHVIVERADLLTTDL